VWRPARAAHGSVVAAGTGTAMPYLLGGWLECLLRTQAWNELVEREEVYLGDKFPSCPWTHPGSLILHTPYRVRYYVHMYMQRSVRAKMRDRVYLAWRAWLTTRYGPLLSRFAL
jgi:predicted acyl esterase